MNANELFAKVDKAEWATAPPECHYEDRKNWAHEVAYRYCSQYGLDPDTWDEYPNFVALLACEVAYRYCEQYGLDPDPDTWDEYLDFVALLEFWQ
jgi:hypothetical protein